jgi:hypothetical protein
MPRPRKTAKQTTARFRLENHLVLARYIANKLGLNEVSDIKQFSDVKEGFGEDERSYMYYRLISKRGNTIPEGRLRQYDDNIRKYFQKLKRNREGKISFKYYQYLALLFSEIYLDNYFQNPVKFLNELNQWVEEAKSDNYFSRRPDLQKIAYWMATGSGKTLIMHANYWQFLAYNKGSSKIDYENIILITTGDEMSKQHLDDLKKSGIPAIMFHGESVGYFEGDKSAVKVISIHKLKLPEDKKGEGVTVDVSNLGTKNLVFVDEGHKGQKSEDLKWKRTRERLAKDGFTFEYSATFGQAIASSDQEIFREYSKAILFDYSYKYFYGDGYGKNFRILNLESKTFTDSQIPILLLANTMSFYEQILEYKKVGPSLKDYKIEKPLWIFVGSRVREEASDILKIAQFLTWLLGTDEKTIKLHIEDILKGNSGIQADKRDIFAPRYPERNFVYLREKKITSEEIYNGIFNEIFDIPPGPMGRRLHLVNLKNAGGEIGLRAGTSDKYFGVIYIGEKSEFLKMVQETNKDIIVESAAIGKSLFDDINDVLSPITLLIGAKKFIEGWNSWRVSSMCLLNVGKNEGPQIIQLFGRGVRLKGKDYGLKRSSFIPGSHPEYIEILETLHVFGIQANYLQIFRQIIEKEDVLSYELPIRIIKMQPFPQDLQILGLRKGWSFDQELIELEPEDGIDARIDLLPRATIIDIREEQTLATTQSQRPRTLKREVMDLLDWNNIYYALLEYKNERELYNITITKDTLKQIMYETKYTLLCNDELINPTSFKSLEQIEDVVVLILKKYFSAYYSRKRNASEKTHLELRSLTIEDENLLCSYRIQINEDDKVLVSNIEDLIRSGKIYTSGTEVKLTGDLRTYIDKNPTTFKNAYFKGHLYQPLMIKQSTERIVTIPAGLNEGETKFVEDLNDYLNSEKSFDAEVYLLRNLTKSKGVGFYESHSFYPDFIMWIKKDPRQTILFIDPKGLTHLGLQDPKLRLHEYLRENIQKELNNQNVKLDAFIVSVTPYQTFIKMHPEQSIRLEEFEKDKHVMFQFKDKGIQNTSYMERLFEIALSGQGSQLD